MKRFVFVKIKRNNGPFSVKTKRNNDPFFVKIKRNRRIRKQRQSIIPKNSLSSRIFFRLTSKHKKNIPNFATRNIPKPLSL